MLRPTSSSDAALRNLAGDGSTDALMAAFDQSQQRPGDPVSLITPLHQPATGPTGGSRRASHRRANATNGPVSRSCICRT